MLRILSIVILALSPSLSFATLTTCKDTKNEKVKDATTELGRLKEDDDARSALASATSSGTSVPNKGQTISDGATANAADFSKAVKANDDRAAECAKQCKDTDTEAKDDAGKKIEAALIRSELKDCKKQLKQIQGIEQQAATANTAADTKANQTKDASKDTKPSESTSSPGKQASSSPMPPISIPPIPPPSTPDKKPDDPTPQTADNSTPPATPAAPAQQNPAQSADSGKADFKTASKPSPDAVAQACAGRNASEISGGCTEQTTQVASLTPSAFSQAAGAGGSSGGGGGGGGGISAASVAGLAAGLNKGESEKDGKSTGLKAASMNMGVDGGGGGGGGSSGGNALGDLDFGFKPNALRNPASTAVKKAADMAVPGQPSVAQEKFSVLRIVTDVYLDKCKAGKLNCGYTK